MSLKRNKGVLVALAAASTIAAVGATAASAPATDSVVVNVLKCAYADGGTTTVPSGTPITIRGFGYEQGTYGLIKDFLLKQQTTLTISGTTTTTHDLSGEWGAPYRDDQGFWQTRLPNTDLGLTLLPGQSIVATYDITFTQPLLVAYPPVGPTGDNGPYLISEDGPASCLITGT